MSRVDTTSIASRIDQLGALKAEIADLQEKAKRLSADLEFHLRSTGESSHDGQLFRAVLVESDRETVDWKAVAERLGPSRQLVTAHTSVTHTSYVKINARKKNAA